VGHIASTRKKNSANSLGGPIGAKRKEYMAATRGHGHKVKKCAIAEKRKKRSATRKLKGS